MLFEDLEVIVTARDQNRKATATVEITIIAIHNLTTDGPRSVAV